MSKLKRHLETDILGYLLFARVPGMTRMGHSAIISPQGNPMAYYFRQDSISRWLVLNNSDSSSPWVLRSLSQLLKQSIRGSE